MLEKEMDNVHNLDRVLSILKFKRRKLLILHFSLIYSLQGLACLTVKRYPENGKVLFKSC